MYPTELKGSSRGDICIPMFTAALFTIAQSWRHPGIHLGWPHCELSQLQGGGSCLGQWADPQAGLEAASSLCNVGKSLPVTLALGSLCVNTGVEWTSSSWPGFHLLRTMIPVCQPGRHIQSASGTAGLEWRMDTDVRSRTSAPTAG